MRHPRKLNLAIMAMALLFAFLSYAAMEVGVTAQITCQQVLSCCGAAACQGPGTPDGCVIACQGGGTATCCSNASGKCICVGGGGDGE